MEFLVQIQVSLSGAMDAATRAELLEAERRRGIELKAAGAIVRIWRIPGRLANVGVWAAPDASELHALLTSLPVFDYTDIHVTPLATHHLEAASEATRPHGS